MIKFFECKICGERLAGDEDETLSGMILGMHIYAKHPEQLGVERK